MFSQIRAWLYAAGAALVGGLAAWGMYNKKKAEWLEVRAQTLEATVHADRVIKKIKKKKKEELSRRESEIKERKDVEKPEDLDDLFDRWD
jgi:hypothetical protein